MTTNEEPTTLAYQPPRLSILHFFFWMAGSSLVLAVCRWNLPVPTLASRVQLYYLGILITGALLFGLCIASLAVMVTDRRQGKRFPVQPGEWVLVLTGVATLLGILQWRLFLLAQDELFSDTLAMIIAGVLFVGYLLLLTVTAYSLQKSRIWSSVFLTAALLLICTVLPYPVDSSFLNFLLANTYPVIVIFFLLAIFLAILMDLMLKTRRGWLHWTGLAVAAATVVWTVCFGIITLVATFQPMYQD